jgi:hypothetical protein
MEFTTQLTNNEKLSIYERSLRDAEKLLFERLIGHGIDPDAFDVNAEHSFDVDVLTDSITAVRLIRRKIAEIGWSPVKLDRVVPQAKKAFCYRLTEQQTSTMIHTLLLAGVDPSEITDEEVGSYIGLKDSSGLTDKQRYMRSVAKIRQANGTVKQILEEM